MTERRGLALLIAAHLLIGLVYAWATPVFEAPDEGYHTAVIRWIVQGRGLPVQQAGVEQAFAQEGSQPPLYYLLGAGLTAWADTDDWDQVFVKNPRSRIGIPGTTHNVNDFRQPVEPAPLAGTRLMVMALRVFSLALNAVTLALAYALGRRVVPAGREPWLWLALALAAFNPMMLFIGASVSNDNLLRPLSTAGLVLALDAARTPRPGLHPLAGLGLVLGLAALTKLSGLVLWPVAALALAYGGLRPTLDDRRGTTALGRLLSLIRRLLFVFSLALAVCGWWYFRNWQLYGDPTGLNAMIAIAGPRSVGLGQLVTQEWYGFYLSFWAIFGVFTILPGVWAQWFFHALTLAALAGGALAAWRNRRALTFDGFLLFTFCLLTLIGVIRWTMQTPASQGRLLFGAIAPLSLGLAAGLLALFPRRWERAVAWGLGGALAVVALVLPVADIAPKYAPPPALTAADLPAGMRPVRAQIGAGMELVGYTAEAEPRRPGEAQGVTLYWRAIQPMSMDYTLALVLFGRGAQGVGQIDTWPGAGRLPTSQWRPGAYYADAYALPVAADAVAPTILKLGVAAWANDPADRLPIRGPDGALLDAITLPAGRLAPASAPAEAPATRDGSRFEHDLTLLGYTARVDEAGVLALTLFWRAAGPLPADYTVFLHFLDQAGREALPPADAPPLGGDWPTSAWLPGETVVDPWRIALPTDLPPGCCDLRLGWYDASSGARLEAYRPDGARWPDDAVILNDVLNPR